MSSRKGSPSDTLIHLCEALSSFLRDHAPREMTPEMRCAARKAAEALRSVLVGGKKTTQWAEPDSDGDQPMAEVAPSSSKPFDLSELRQLLLDRSCEPEEPAESVPLKISSTFKRLMDRMSQETSSRDELFYCGYCYTYVVGRRHWAKHEVKHRHQGLLPIFSLSCPSCNLYLHGPKALTKAYFEYHTRRISHPFEEEFPNLVVVMRGLERAAAESVQLRIGFCLVCHEHFFHSPFWILHNNLHGPEERLGRFSCPICHLRLLGPPDVIIRIVEHPMHLYVDRCFREG